MDLFSANLSPTPQLKRAIGYLVSASKPGYIPRGRLITMASGAYPRLLTQYNAPLQL